MVSTISAACSVMRWPSKLVAGAAAMDGDIDAVVLEDLFELLDVGEARHVFEDQRLGGEQRGDHQRQRGVLGAGNGDFAPQLVATDETDAIHAEFPVSRALRRGARAGRDGCA